MLREVKRAEAQAKRFDPTTQIAEARRAAATARAEAERLRGRRWLKNATTAANAESLDRSAAELEVIANDLEAKAERERINPTIEWVDMNALMSSNVAAPCLLGIVEGEAAHAADEGVRAAQLQGGEFAKTFWTFGGKVYETDDDLDADDVKALANQKANAKRRRLDQARALHDAADRGQVGSRDARIQDDRPPPDG